MTSLTIYRGLPGSGKTTAAKFARALEPDNTVRINRDALRNALFGSDSQDYYACGKEVLYRKEKLITTVQHDAIRDALREGKNVLVDDTNLPVRTGRGLRKIAVAAGAEFSMVDMSDVPLEVCLARNAARKDKEPVPEAVIRSMYERYIQGGMAPIPPLEEEVAADDDIVPAPQDVTLPRAYLVDIDGTLARHGTRSPFDFSRVSEDTPFQDVVDTVNILSESAEIIFMSGRSEECRPETQLWLDAQMLPPGRLFMRGSGDHRQDTKVKYDLFNEHVRGKYNVLGVIDDRPVVCRQWRAMGLTTFQVGDPHNEF